MRLNIWLCTTLVQFSIQVRRFLHYIVYYSLLQPLWFPEPKKVASVLSVNKSSFGNHQTPPQTHLFEKNTCYTVVRITPNLHWKWTNMSHFYIHKICSGNHEFQWWSREELRKVQTECSVQQLSNNSFIFSYVQHRYILDDSDVLNW